MENKIPSKLTEAEEKTIRELTTEDGQMYGSGKTEITKLLEEIDFLRGLVNDLSQDGHLEIYQKGYDKGREEGKEEGYDLGYTAGYDNGIEYFRDTYE